MNQPSSKPPLPGDTSAPTAHIAVTAPGGGPWRARWQLAVLPFALLIPFGLYFFRILAEEADPTKSDILAHLGFVARGASEGVWPPHPLFHLSVYLASLFTPSIAAMSIGASCVLTTALLAKVMLTGGLLVRNGLTPFAAGAWAITLAIAAPLPNWWQFPHVYAGQLSPNVWHNPTTVFAMPLALLFFLHSQASLEKPSVRGILSIGTMAFLSALAKPNFLLAFLPVYGLLMADAVRRRRLRPTAALAVLAALCPAALVMFSTALFVNGADSRAVLAPLAVWAATSPSPALSLLLSIAFPLAVVSLYPRQTFADGAACLAWAVFDVALIQYIVFAEAGSRFTHGNFVWGSIVALYILFVVSLSIVCRQAQSWRRLVALSVFGLHVVTGVFWLGRQIAGLGYM